MEKKRFTELANAYLINQLRKAADKELIARFYSLVFLRHSTQQINYQSTILWCKRSSFSMVYRLFICASPKCKTPQ